MGYAIGEHIDLRKSTLSFGEACESAKSNALMRLCKGIGMSLKLWNKEFVDYWVSNYAKKVRNERGEEEWVKLTSEEREAKKQNFIKAVHSLGLDSKTYKQELQKFGYSSSKDVPIGKMTEVYLHLKNIASKQKEQKENKKEGENGYNEN